MNSSLCVDLHGKAVSFLLLSMPVDVVLLNDPQFFDVPLDVWMSDDYQAGLASLLKRTRPKSGVDLTRHVELTTSPSQLRAFGWAPAKKDEKPKGGKAT